MKWGRFLAIVGSALLIAFAAALMVRVQRERSVLEMATSPNYCPYEFVTTAGGQRSLQGFDIDLARAIAERLGYRLQIREMLFNGLLLAVRDDEVDLAMSAITPTPERRRIVQFSSIYYEAESALVLKENSAVQSVADLGNLRVGVKPRTVHEQLLHALIGGAGAQAELEIRPFKQAEAAIQAVKAGSVDVAVLDRFIIRDLIVPSDGLRVVEISNEEPFAGAAIAFPSDSRLVSSVNRVLREFDTDGTLQQMIHQWFDDYACE